MKFCHMCGTQCEDNAKFCLKCGTPLAETQSVVEPVAEPVPQFEEQQTQYSYGAPTGGSENTSYQGEPVWGAGNGNNYGIKERSIPVAIILSLVTCGIYGIYWMIKMNDEINQLAGETQATSGGMVFLFSLLTCGIYGIYWVYKMGERCDRIKGATDGNSAILYLVLSLIGLSIVDYCLMQDTINKAL